MHNVLILATFNLLLHRKNKKLRQNIDIYQSDAIQKIVTDIFSDGETSGQESEAHTTI